MRCFYCNRNEATKSYLRVIKGKEENEYYCAECYGKKFLEEKTENGTSSFSACPYCGTTLSEFRASSIVGCPYCYQTLTAGLVPYVIRMQGDACGHRGKKPPLSVEDEVLFDKAEFVNEEERDEYRESLEMRERYARQSRELQMLMCFSELDEGRRAEYREKLERMERTGRVEDEIVW